MKDQLTIGITDCGSFPNYERWMTREAGIDVIKLSYKDNNFEEIRKCNGVILSGGEDVHPRIYNKLEYLPYCDAIDEQRDEFELKVLEYTEANAIPVLGICRGLQVANVFFGGTLIPDIPSFGKYNHSKFPDRDRYHAIAADPQSMLASICGTVEGEVNSAHHQSAEIIGKGLVVNSFSSEGVVEGIERKDRSKGAYLMLVQWHPERMTDQKNPFTLEVRQSFIDAVRG